jgi:hypothetical protein
MSDYYKKSQDYEYILNDLSIKKKKLIALNNITIIIFYDNKIEKLYLEKNDSLRLNKNLIHTHKFNKDNYVDEYKDATKNNFIKIICNTNMLRFENYNNSNEIIMEGEEDKWNTIFNK